MQGRVGLIVLRTTSQQTNNNATHTINMLLPSYRQNHKKFLTGYQFRVSKNGKVNASKLAAFEAFMFTCTFGLLLWEKSCPVEGSQ